ncbi:MAG: IS110 family transposase [Acidobacteriota bacterium]|nr:IS110 family transposase [Acidobacteriota bacterium]
MFVGWDWASESHDVTVLDDSGGIVTRFSLRHNEEGIMSAIHRLRALGGPEEVPVAIESTCGLVVDRLLEAGLVVHCVHPNSFNAARPRWGTSRAKSDPGDSYKLADYLRTDGHRLRRLAPMDRATANLRALSRQRDDLVAAKVSATNQLAALLDHHWPGAKAVFFRLDSEIALAFLEDYPTPRSAERLGVSRMAQFCRRHSYCGRRSPEKLLERLREAPESVGALDDDVLGACVRQAVAGLRASLTSIDQLEGLMGAELMGHPAAALFGAMPRVGEVNLAQLIAEVYPILARAQSATHAAAEVGASPVTRASGHGRSVNFRWATNARARQALSTYADNSRHASPWAAHLYREARLRGKRHPHAIRIVMRSWTRVMWACLQSGVAYDPARHGQEIHFRGLDTGVAA